MRVILFFIWGFTVVRRTPHTKWVVGHDLEPWAWDFDCSSKLFFVNGKSWNPVSWTPLLKYLWDWNLSPIVYDFCKSMVFVSIRCSISPENRKLHEQIRNPYERSHQQWGKAFCKNTLNFRGGDTCLVLQAGRHGKFFFFLFFFFK